MKDYDHVVVWLDYYNKHLTKAQGRRVAKEGCVFDPSLKELSTAAGEAGIKVAESSEKARFPRRPYVRSGYIAVPKGQEPKSGALGRISGKLVAGRAKRAKKR